MLINGFSLVTAEKFERALNGLERSDGTKFGGVGGGAYVQDEKLFIDGEEVTGAELSKLELAILAEYDRIGGLIRKGTDKVKTGSFYDFKGKKPRTEPKIIYIFNINGKFVEVPDGVELPGIVKAANIMAEEGAAEAAAKPKKAKRAKSGSEE